MLELTLPDTEWYNETTNEFVSVKGCSVIMEHSLLAISKWEQKFHKAFFSTAEKTEEELLYYFQCMTISPKVTPDTFKGLPKDIYQQITEYLQDPMTATTIKHDPNQRPSRDVITNELVYYWMTELGIDLSWENKPFNQLMTLIQVCNIKKANEQKMNKQAMSAKNRNLNAARRAAHHSKG